MFFGGFSDEVLIKLAAETNQLHGLPFTVYFYLLGMLILAAAGILVHL